VTTTRHERREAERRRKKRPQRATGGRRGPPGWVAPAVVIGVLALGVVGLRAAGVFDAPPPPLNIDAITVAPGEVVGTKQTDTPATHVANGLQVTYSTNPPTSGSHWNLPHAGWGVKDTSQEEERFVHNLEHGGIVIGYKDLTPDELAQLKTLVRQLIAGPYKKVLLHPYPPLTGAKIAVTAWDWLLKLDAFDQTQIVKFVKAHYQGPDAPEPTAQ
jgi:hypothetical protein